MKSIVSAMLRIVLGTILLSSAAYAAQSNQSLVDRAKATVEDMKDDASFGNSPELLNRAKAVMIVPQLVKGGFIFGAEGGHGVMVARNGNSWSNPAFFDIGAGSFGLQIGLEEAELVMFVMSDRALKAWMKNEVKLGVNAGLTVIVVGTNAEADATTHANVDVIAWARAKGAYAGLTLAGSVIKPNTKSDAGYYGAKLSPESILFKGQGAPKNNGAGPLKAALADAAASARPPRK